MKKRRSVDRILSDMRKITSLSSKEYKIWIKSKKRSKGNRRPRIANDDSQDTFDPNEEGI